MSLTRDCLGSQTAILSEDRRLDYLAYARPLDLKLWSPGVGISVSRFALEGPIEQRDTNTPDPVAQWFQSSYSVQAGLGTWLGDGPRTHAALGLGLRFLSESIGQASGDGFSLDLGSLYRATPWLNLGWSAENLLSRVSWSTGYADSSPRSLRLGASGRFWDRRIMATADLELSVSQDTRFRAGLECWITPEILALRVGVDHDRLSAGLGANWDFGGTSLGLDYAFRTDPVTSGSLDHRFSLSLAFDDSDAKEKPQ